MTETKETYQTVAKKTVGSVTPPTHTAFRVEKYEGEKDKWIKVGKAYWKPEKDQMTLYQDGGSKLIILPVKEWVAKVQPHVSA